MNYVLLFLKMGLKRNFLGIGGYYVCTSVAEYV